MSLSLLAGILNTELIEAAGIAVRSLAGQGSYAPWHRGPETGFAARQAPLGAWLPRLAGLARKGGPGDLQDARTRRNPQLCAVMAPFLGVPK